MPDDRNAAESVPSHARDNWLGHTPYLVAVLGLGWDIATHDRTAFLAMMIESLIGFLVAAAWWDWARRHSSRLLTKGVLAMVTLAFVLSASLWFSRLVVISRFNESQGVSGYRGQ